MAKEGEGACCVSKSDHGNESELKSPPLKRRRLTYEEKRDFLMSNKRVTMYSVLL